MPMFRRVRIHATVETESMLLTEEQIDGALGDLRDKLAHLDLAVLSIEPSEPAAATDDDPWTHAGRAVE